MRMRKKILIIVLSIVSLNNTFAFSITNKNINDLKFGKTNETVRQLQFFLNEYGFFSSEEGPGSPGNETNYFGNSTRDSITIFQEYTGLHSTGKIDFATGESINEYIKNISKRNAQDYPTDDEDYGKYIQDNYDTDIVDFYSTKNNIEPEKNHVVKEKNVDSSKWTISNLLEKTSHGNTNKNITDILNKFFNK
jgi:peptidoglycan hydrolase-like protein with peptidoglycan-binding domain